MKCQNSNVCITPSPHMSSFYLEAVYHSLFACSLSPTFPLISTKFAPHIHYEACKWGYKQCSNINGFFKKKKTLISFTWPAWNERRDLMNIFWYSYVNEMADLSKWNENRSQTEKRERDELQKKPWQNRNIFDVQCKNLFLFWKNDKNISVRSHILSGTYHVVTFNWSKIGL